MRNIYIVIVAVFSSISCEKVLEVDDPKSKIPIASVFADDITATSAVTGMYASFLTQRSFASGSPQSVTVIAALSADDFVNFLPEFELAMEVYQNNIQPDNPHILDIWTTAYENIYRANAILETLSKSTGITASLKEQLLGEAYFVRAFCHFYLVNMFGGVPVITTTDYQKNTQAHRVTIDEVYDKIIEDLMLAQEKLNENYPSSDRVRANKATATALLARVYLYRGNWSDAEFQSSSLINNGNYELESSLDNVFLSTSREAIWQLRQTASDVNTWEGNSFILTDIPQHYLTPELVNSFESGDSRYINWISSFDAGSQIFQFPFKYKIKFGGPSSTPSVPISEFSMVFRLAEQYLIRAEARTHLNKLEDAISDLDEIRNRADLDLIHDTDPGISQENLLTSIEHERRCELFTEWGHRWFDLKRTGRATAVLGSLKADWNATDTLYPIPELEMTRNPSLGEQNQGY